MLYPKSFLTLLLLGFALAMLPLLFAFGNAAVYVDRLAEQSTNTVVQAVQATRASRVLVEQLSRMERSARQYAVLDDVQLIDAYRIAHLKFIASLQLLGRLPLSQQQIAALAKLGGQETALYEELKQSTDHAAAMQDDVIKPGSKAGIKPGVKTGSKPRKHALPNTRLPQLELPLVGLSSASLEQFQQLSQQASDILAENNRLIDLESASLAENAEHIQTLLFWQSLTLLPVSFLVALLITYLVARPIRKMDKAIKLLGEGNYQNPINIDGPGDIRVLGERLDWLRAQLQVVEEEKQRFLRNISHELKTPLTAIRQGSELLSDEVGGSLTAQQKEITDILRDNSLRLQNMIENLLHYTAAQFKKPALNLTDVELKACMQGIVDSYALLLDSKHIKIVADTQPVNLLCDEQKMHSVLDNLLSNAIKYTPQSGQIRLRIYRDLAHAIIEVHDSGPGVMTADKTKLFDPFFRGSAVYQSLVSGSGLGLSIAKEYVDAHQGHISLLPSATGAHFRVKLPFNPTHLISKREENAQQ